MIFVGAIYVIYFEIVKNKEKINFNSVLNDILSIKGLIIITIVFLLQFLNWSLEALKFKKIISKVEKLHFWTSLKSVYAGNAIGVLTPNKIGTFIGRALFLRSRNVVSVVSSTMLGNLAQLIATTLFGVIGFVIATSVETNLRFYNIEFPVFGLIISILLLIILSVLFFSPSFLYKVSRKLPVLKKYSNKVEYFCAFTKRELFSVMAYAILRYIVFAMQFFILFQLFSVNINLLSFLAFIGVLYLIVTFIPSPFMGNLFTREAVILLLLANYHSTTEVLSASFILWLINIAFPAILGSLIFLFNRKKIDIEA